MGEGIIACKQIRNMRNILSEGSHVKVPLGMHRRRCKECVKMDVNGY